MIINHNLSSLNTYNKSSYNNNAITKSLEKLSSGLAINRASDNAAGLAISEKMRGQIRGLDQASKNANDGISLINTAEGSLNEIHSILQRVRELSVQSANDTNTNNDRDQLQKEVEQLKANIQNISTDTEFNTIKLFDGSLSSENNTSQYKTSGNLEVLNFETGDGLTLSGPYSIIAKEKIIGGTTTQSVTNLINSLNFEEEDIIIGNVADGAYYFFVSANGSNFDITLQTLSGVEIGTATNVSGTSDVTIGNFTLKFDNNYKKAVFGHAGSFKVITTSTSGVSDGFEIELLDNNNILGTGTVQNNDVFIKNIIGDTMVSFKTTGSIADGQYYNFDFVRPNNSPLKLQIGANSNQTLDLDISNIGLGTLGIKSLDLSTQQSSSNAIELTDNAISKISSERSKLGAIHNRLTHAMANNNSASENLSSSESRIRDIDMASEMMQYTKANIIFQSSQSMLAQANQQPKNILQLLQ